MGLLRAHYDAYVKRRLIHETELESEALEALRSDANKGSYAAMEKAESILRKARTEPVTADYKQKCETLADSLFEKIGSQLTVKRHGAQNRTRGAFMDGIDEPLNNAAWLSAQFRARVPCRMNCAAGGDRPNPQPHQSRPRRLLRQPRRARQPKAHCEFRSVEG